MSLNALYFKSEWNDKFNPADTDTRTFHGILSDSRVSIINAVHFETETLDAISLDYKGYNEMILIMSKNNDITSIASRIDINSIIDAKTNGTLAFVDLSMPKFKSELAFDCNDVLEDLGVNLRPDNIGQFTNESGLNNLSIMFKQNTTLTTDENGTEAASVSSGEIEDNIASIPNHYVSFNLDRPFFYLVQNRITGSILLAGQYVQP